MNQQQLLAQMREANERLVVATVRAERSAEEAETARAAAADSEERFRSLVIASSAIVWRASAAGAVCFEADAWRSFTGMTASNDSWLNAVHPEDRDRVADVWTSAVATSTNYTCEHRIRRAEGGYAWVIARAVPIIRNGSAREWIGMMTDITERITMERARDEFMAVLGHDLRSPLASIQLSAAALQQVPLEPPYGGLVEGIHSSARRMSALIHDLMDLARGRLGGGIPVSKRTCDLAQICTELVEEAKNTDPMRIIGIVSQGDCVGLWDPGRISQLMSNLIGNALAHGTDPVEITIVGDRDDVLVLVANRGPAIPAGILATLFQPFSGARKTRTTVSNSGGMGLGLYIVSEIVRAHGGAIEVNSEAGLTTFSLRLPRRSR